MIIKDLVANILLIIEEYNKENKNSDLAPYSNDEDINDKILPLISNILNEVSSVIKIEKHSTILVENNTSEYVAYILPKDFKQLNNIVIENKSLENTFEYFIFGGKLWIKNYKGNINLYYYAIPNLINNDTVYNYELGIDNDAFSIISSGVVSELFKMDLIYNYAPYENEYLRRLKAYNDSKTIGMARVVLWDS